MIKQIPEQTSLPPHLSRIGGYQIKALTEEHKKQAIQLLAEEFSKKEPLVVAYFRNNQETAFEGCRSYWLKYGNQFFESGLSVGCFDSLTNELVGTLLSKDVIAIPKNQQKAIEGQSLVSALDQFAKLLLSLIPSPYQEIVNGGSAKAAQLRGAALRNQQMGKALMYRMVQCSQYLSFKRGYDYSFTMTSNVKSSAIMQRMKYTKIVEYDARQFEHRGKRVLEGISQLNRHQFLWIKKIGPLQHIVPKL